MMSKKKIDYLIEERLERIKKLESDYEHYTWSLESITKKLKFNKEILEDLRNM